MEEKDANDEDEDDDHDVDDVFLLLVLDDPRFSFSPHSTRTHFWLLFFEPPLPIHTYALPWHHSKSKTPDMRMR